MAGFGGESEDGADGNDEDDEEETIDDSTIQTNIMTDHTHVEISESAMAHMNIHSSAEVATPDTDGTNDVVMAVEQEPVRSPVAETLPFFVDTVGDSKLTGNFKANGKQPLRRAPSPSPSESSEEVVFHGRNKPAVSSKPVKPPKYSTPSAPQLQIQTPHVTDSLLAALDAPSSFPNDAPPSPPGSWTANPPKPGSQQMSQEEWTPAPSHPYWKKERPHLDRDPSSSGIKMREELPVRGSKAVRSEPAAADGQKDAEETIASLQADWKQTVKSKRRARDADPSLDGSFKDDVDLKASSSRRRKRGRKKSNRQLKEACISDEEDDEEDDAADRDYMANLMAQLDAEDPSGNIKAVLASGNVLTPGEAVSGPSMVVDGRAYGEDEVLKQGGSDEWEDEDDSSESSLIGQDLSELSGNGEGPNASDLESSELEDELEYTEREQWEDEEDIRQRRIERMSDEQYARLLAKQLELGIDAEDLILEDGEYESEDPEAFGDLGEARAGLQDITNSSFGRVTKKPGMHKRRGQGGFSFPDASALADTVEQYGESGFDIMDFERPSLRNTKKGRKGKLPAELDGLSDDELKDNLTSQWEKDRTTKRLKKAEREELRAQGLLGASGRNGKADLSQKYLQGMTTAQVHDELRIFLQNDGQQARPFPPMDKTDRKALHQVADALDLKSKSVGSGKNRYPVLYKTSFTLEYDEYTFNKIISASTRGFYKNSSFKGKKAAAAKRQAKGRSRPGAGGGFDKAAVSVRHGEVVGAGAKEIGKESFGHKLMERMG